jgi:osmotically inducible lipoprotein OsmB
MDKLGTTLVSLTLLSVLLATFLLLSACGNQPGERALSGAGIGAGVGAATGVLTGGDPMTGAVVGGAVGAAAGGLTKKKDVDLGKPAWK